MKVLLLLEAKLRANDPDALRRLLLEHRGMAGSRRVLHRCYCIVMAAMVLCDSEECYDGNAAMLIQSDDGTKPAEAPIVGHLRTIATGTMLVAVIACMFALVSVLLAQGLHAAGAAVTIP